MTTNLLDRNVKKKKLKPRTVGEVWFIPTYGITLHSRLVCERRRPWIIAFMSKRKILGWIETNLRWSEDVNKYQQFVLSGLLTKFCRFLLW